MRLARTRTLAAIAAATACVALCAPTRAQSINIDISSLSGTPSSSYGAAAGQAGVWNGIPGGAQGTVFDLVDLAASAGTPRAEERPEVGGVDRSTPIEVRGARSVARSPCAEQNAEVGGVDRSTPIEVRGARFVARSPCAKQNAEVRRVDHAVVREIARAAGAEGGRLDGELRGGLDAGEVSTADANFVEPLVINLPAWQLD